jgi:hypothetical protein
MTLDSPTHDMKRRTRALLVAALAFASVAIAAAWLVLHGPAQRDESPPSAEQLRRHWQASARWMREHEQQVVAEGNPMLWRMVRDAAALQGDAVLAQMVQRYRQRFFGGQARDAWVLLIDSQATLLPLQPTHVQALPAYMKLFAYGMTCDARIGEMEIVRKQMGPHWCSAFAVRRVLQQRKCVTHQLVGIMLMQQRGCGDAAQVAAMTTKLQDRTVDELALDFVMRDEHLQRVLLLYWTGASDRVKPVWLNRLLRAQHSDGSWDYGSDASRWISGQPDTFAETFHATAQGLLVVALALRDAESSKR